MRFNLAGFPVEIHYSFFIVAGLLGISAGRIELIALWIGVLFVSILVHELGHAFAGRAYGLQPEIRLYSMGGLTSWASARRLTPRQSILVSVAGPAAGLALGGLVLAFNTFGAIELTPLGAFTVRQLLWVNIVWSLVNLMPVVPLDGGNVTRELVRMYRGYPDERLPALISMIVAAGLFFFALSIGLSFAAILAGFLAYSNYMTYTGAAGGASFPGMTR